MWRSEQQAIFHKEAFLLSIQAYGDSENFEAAVCKAQSQPLAEQAVPFTNTGANDDIELSLWERGKSLGMVTQISIHKRNDTLELTCLFTSTRVKPIASILTVTLRVRRTPTSARKHSNSA
jgi:hypothetical protein